MQTQVPDPTSVLTADHLEIWENTIIQGEDESGGSYLAPSAPSDLTLPNAVEHLRRKAHHQKRRDAIKVQANLLMAPLLAQVDQIKSWAAAETGDCERRAAFHDNWLIAYATLNPPAKGKTVKLPGGSITSRTAEKWNYGDEDALLKLLQQSRVPVLRTKVELDKKALKSSAYQDENGWYIPNTDGEAISLPITVTTETTYKVELE